MLDGVGERAEVVDDVRVGALQDRVEPPPVVDGIDLADLVGVGGGLPSLSDGDGLITTPSSNPSLAAASHRLHSQPVGELLVMGDRDAGLGVGEPGRVDPADMAEVGEAPRLVERRPTSPPGRRTRGHRSGVVGEPADGVAVAKPPMSSRA